MSLNMAENARINCSDYARFLNMPDQGFKYVSGIKYARVLKMTEYRCSEYCEYILIQT